MTTVRDTGPTPARVARARAAHEEHLERVRGLAARTVAGHSMDAQDCQHLLAMLGLDVRGADAAVASGRD